MEIGEFSKKVGLPASTLRYYERIGLLPSPARVGGRRIYRPTDLARGRLLSAARRLGFSIRELREVALPDLDAGGVKSAAARKAQALSRDIDALTKKQAALIALSQCDCADPAGCPETQALRG